MNHRVDKSAVMSPEKRILLALSGVALVLSTGVIGYVLIEGWTFQESLYMAIITVTTVGFSEVRPLSPAGRYFTVGLIVLGVGFVFYSAGTIIEMMVEGTIRDIMGRRKVEKQINALKEHYIICGCGRMGGIVVEELQKHRLPLVVIETDSDMVRDLLDKGILAIHGNAGEEAILREAGIERARGLVATASTDAENLFITITARNLNKDLSISARAETRETVKKLLQVGADKVASPYLIGAHHLARTILKPAVTQFIELSSLERKMDIRLEEVRVATRSLLNGKQLIDTPIRSELGIIVLAMEKKDGAMLFNPPSDQVVEHDDKLIVIGTLDQIDRLTEMAS